jgi:transcriptional regulator with XRE-family HTH domain
LSPEETAIAEGIGRNVARLRIAAGLSVLEVAAKAGVISPHLTDIENGRGIPDWGLVFTLAAVLSADGPGRLLEGIECRESPDGAIYIAGHRIAPAGLPDDSDEALDRRAW